MIAVLSRKKYLTRFSIGDILHIMVKNGMSEAAIRSRMEAIERELVKKKQLMLEYKRCRLIEFFKPYKWQENARDLIARNTITIIPAPNKIGKTAVSLCTMFSWLLGYEPWCRVDEGYPGAVRDGNIFYRASSLGIKPPVRIRLTGEDWDSHFGTSLIPEMNKWMVMPVNYNPEEVELGKHVSPWLKSAPKKTKDVPRLFEFKNGSILDLMTYKQDIKLFESWKGDGWIADEPPPQEIFESTSARGLFLSQGKVLMAITPLSNPWILDELILSGRKDVGVMDGLTILDNEDVVRDDTEVLKNAGLSDGEIAQYFQMLINYEGKTKVEHLREVDTFLENAILKRAA